MFSDKILSCRKKSGFIAKIGTKEGIQAGTLPIDREISENREALNPDDYDLDYLDYIYSDPDAEENLYDYIYRDELFSDSEDHASNDYLYVI